MDVALYRLALLLTVLPQGMQLWSTLRWMLTTGLPRLLFRSTRRLTISSSRLRWSFSSRVDVIRRVHGVGYAPLLAHGAANSSTDVASKEAGQKPRESHSSSI